MKLPSSTTYKHIYKCQVTSQVTALKPTEAAVTTHYCRAATRRRATLQVFNTMLLYLVGAIGFASRASRPINVTRSLVLRWPPTATSTSYSDMASVSRHSDFVLYTPCLPTDLCPLSTTEFDEVFVSHSSVVLLLVSRVHASL
ncbi:unnamed protein product [Colias eurytheme]|nr:unnamed protein product [Colias eurytheme]